MFVEIVTIGDELCRGEVVDTNSSWLAGELWDLEITVAWMTSCRDDEADIEQALGQAAGRADVVLVSGGLGPTGDDLTVEVVARMIGSEPVVDEPAKKRMEERFAAIKFKLTPNNFKQVQVPRGALVLGNPAGSAPAFEVALGRTPVICMPGVPRELKAIFGSSVKERLIRLRESRGETIQRIARRVYRTFGAGESHIAARLDGLFDGLFVDVPGTSVHYQVPFPEVLVKLVVRDRDTDAARQRLEALDALVRERLAPHLHGIDDDGLPVVLGRALKENRLTMATAESCTGGLVAALITEVAGSSSYFLGAAVTYSNDEKVRQLGVSQATLAEHGAVSEECAQEMAGGARDRFGADYAAAVTGIAGPGGGTPDKPVGTVWVAVAGPGGTTTRQLAWHSDRSRIRRRSAYWAMAMTLEQVNGDQSAD